MRRLRKTTWAMVIWTVLCGLVTILWLSGDVTGTSQLRSGEAVQVDDRFAVTLVSTSPFTIRVANTSTSDAWFDYSDITMVDSRGAEHEPTFESGAGDSVPADGSITKELSFGNIGDASPVSWHWECDACEAGETIGRVLVFILMGGAYWFGMLVLFVVWLVTRSPRVVPVVIETHPADE